MQKTFIDVIDTGSNGKSTIKKSPALVADLQQDTLGPYELGKVYLEDCIQGMKRVPSKVIH